MGPAGDNLGDHLFIHDLLDHGIALLVRSGGPDLLFQVRDRIILQLGSPFVIRIVLGLGELEFRLFELFLPLFHLIQFLLFLLPAAELDILFLIQLFQFLFDIFFSFQRPRIRLIHQGCPFDLQGHDAPVEFIQFGRHGIHFHPDRSTGFINQVNGLVRQEPVGNIPVGQHSCRHDGLILDLDAMMALKAVLETSENRDGILDRRFTDLDLLESSFQGPVFFDIFPVFIKGRGTDALEFPAGQHRLEQIGRIHGTLCLAGPDQVVQFIDEQNDLSVGFLDLVEHALEPFLKFTAVLGTGNHRTHVEFDQALVLQTERDIPLHDPPGKAFHDCRLADTRFTDQDRIVLGLAGKNLDYPADFVVSADHRINLAVLDILHQVMSVLAQGIKLAFCCLFVHCHTASPFRFRFFRRLCRNPEIIPDLGHQRGICFQHADQEGRTAHVGVIVGLHVIQGMRIRLVDVP